MPAVARPPSPFRSKKFSIYAPPDLTAALDAATTEEVARGASLGFRVSESAALVNVLRVRFGLPSPAAAPPVAGTQIALPLETAPAAAPVPASPTPGSSSPPPAVEPEPARRPDDNQVEPALETEPEPEPPPVAPAVPPPVRPSRGGAPRRAAPPPPPKSKAKGAPAKGKRR